MCPRVSCLYNIIYSQDTRGHFLRFLFIFFYIITFLLYKIFLSFIFLFLLKEIKDIIKNNDNTWR